MEYHSIFTQWNLVLGIMSQIYEHAQNKQGLAYTPILLKTSDYIPVYAFFTEVINTYLFGYCGVQHPSFKLWIYHTSTYLSQCK